MDQNNSPTTNKKEKAWNWVSIVLGVLILCAGMFSWFGTDEETNNMLIEAGVAQTCTALLNEYPDAQPHLQKVADTLTAAIEARTTSPEVLADLISDALAEATGQNINTEAFVKALVRKINEVHKVSETEEQYHVKLKVLITGINNTIK